MDTIRLDIIFSEQLYAIIVFYYNNIMLYNAL